MENNEVIEVAETVGELNDSVKGTAMKTVIKGVGLVSIGIAAWEFVLKPIGHLIKSRLNAKKQQDSEDDPDIDVANDPID